MPYLVATQNNARDLQEPIIEPPINDMVIAHYGPFCLVCGGSFKPNPKNTYDDRLCDRCTAEEIEDEINKRMVEDRG